MKPCNRVFQFLLGFCLTTGGVGCSEVEERVPPISADLAAAGYTTPGTHATEGKGRNLPPPAPPYVTPSLTSGTLGYTYTFYIYPHGGAYFNTHPGKLGTGVVAPTNVTIASLFRTTSYLRVTVWLHDYGLTGYKTFSVTNCAGYGVTCPFTFNVLKNHYPGYIDSSSKDYFYQGDPIDVTVSGTYTHWNAAKTTIAPSHAGITASINAIYSSTSASLHFTSTSTLTPGDYSFKLHTEGEHVEYPIEVRLAPGISPTVSHSVMGRDVIFSITGNSSTNFQSTTDVEFYDESDIEILSKTRLNSHKIYVAARLHDTMSPGIKGVRVTDCAPNYGGTCTAQFEVLPYAAGAEPSATLSESVVYQSDDMEEQVTGVNTTFSSATTVESSCSGITATITEVRSATDMRVRLQVDPGAQIGGATLTFHTAAQHVVVPITVEEKPAIISMTPDTVQQGHVQTVTLFGNSTADFNNATFSLVGSGVMQIRNVDILGPKKARFAILVRNDTPLGPKSVVVQNCPRECSVGFTVREGGAPPSVSLHPPFVYQGDSDDFEIRGENNPFDENTIVGLESGGSGITLQVYKIASDGITLGMTAQPTATLGTWTLSTQTQAKYAATQFEVLPQPELTSVTPSSVEEGSTITLAIMGNTSANFENAVVSFPTSSGNMVVHNKQWNSGTPNYMEVDVLVHDYIEPGTYALSVAHCEKVRGKTCSSSVYVSPYSVPPTAQFSRAYGYRDEVYSVSLDGTNTNFTPGVTTMTCDSPGVVPTITTVDSTVLVHLELDVGSEAALGPYTCSANTNGEHVQAVFTVRDAPAVGSLTPNALQQGSTIDATLIGINTHFNRSETVLSIDSTYVTIESSTIDSSSLLTLVLRADEFAPRTEYTLSVTTGYEKIEAAVTVERGTPWVELSPSAFDMLTRGVMVTVHGHYTEFSETPMLRITPDSSCGVIAHGISVHGTFDATFLLDVPLYANPAGCVLTFHDGTGVDATSFITIHQLYQDLDSSGQLLQGEHLLSGGSNYYKISLDEGESVKVRITRDPYDYLDPVLTLSDGSALFEAPLAQNDDENVATYNSLVVYQSPTESDYYLKVVDRLGMNSGAYDLSIAPYQPETCEEALSNDTLTSAEGVEFGLVKGRFPGVDERDCYSLLGTYPTERLAVRVVALDVSPYATSGALTSLAVYNASMTVTATSLGGEYGQDPSLYVDSTDARYICIDTQDATNTGNFYLLNVTPALLINEVRHTEDASWQGSFIELVGEPNYDLTGCLLEATSTLLETLGDGSTQEVEGPSFQIDLVTQDGTAMTLSPYGYQVYAHDTLVPGTTSATTYHDMFLPAPEEEHPYHSVTISLVCPVAQTPTLIDQVCYMSGPPENCVPQDGCVCSPSGESIGRGYRVDTNRSSHDFMPQIEASPWEENLTQVK